MNPKRDEPLLAVLPLTIRRPKAAHAPSPTRSLCRLLGSFTTFIIMGILGDFAGTARAPVIYLCLVAFLLGMASFTYSKWIEQPGIRAGADAVKRLIDEKINPLYERSEFKLRWAVSRLQFRPPLQGRGGRAGSGQCTSLMALPCSLVRCSRLPT